MKHLRALLILVLVSCTEMRVKKYNDLLNPRVGTAKKEEVGKLLGNPVSCSQELEGEKCEYRTSHARNHPVPDVYRQERALGPDLSPYDHFDVLHVRYDGFGILKSWEPVVIPSN